MGLLQKNKICDNLIFLIKYARKFRKYAIFRQNITAKYDIIIIENIDK